MHDTHLLEKLYRSIVDLCGKHSIGRVSELRVEVDEGSHIDGTHLLSHLIERDGTLFGSWTKVLVSRQPFDKLTAIITSIEGEARD